MKKILWGAVPLLFLSAIAIAQAPGGVTSGLKLWLKADAGVTLAGIDVSEWQDQSGNNNHFNQPIAANRPTYFGTQSGLLNYNPSIEFTGNQSEYLRKVGGIFGTGSYTDVAVFAMSTSNSSMQAGIFNKPLFHENTGPGVSTFVRLSPGVSETNWWGGAGTQMHSFWNFPYASPTCLWSDIDRPGTQSLRYNGLQKASGTQSILFNGIGNDACIGSNNATQYFWGSMYEVAIYTAPLSESDVQKIQSYHAIKWGVALDQTSATNYIATDGSIVWNATLNSLFNTNVMGIACDSAEALLQKQSLGGILSIGLNTIATTNAANTGIFTNDKSYMMLANNNGGTAVQTIDLPAMYTNGQRLSSEWKVQTTNFNNSTNPLSLQFNLQQVSEAGSVPADFSLLIDVDGDGNFTTGTVISVPATSLSGNLLTFGGVIQLTNGAVFTVLTKPVFYAPGGVSSGLRLWVRADMGITADGGVTTKWGDQTANAYHFNQSTIASKPVYNATANQLNYNPTLGFNGNQTVSSAVNVLFPGNYTAVSLFSVCQSSNGTGGSVFNQATVSIFDAQLRLVPDSAGDINWHGTSPGTRIKAPGWGATFRNKPILLSGVNKQSDQRLFCNGALAATGSLNVGFGSSSGAGTATIGSVASYFSGQISEVILYLTTLTDIEVQKIQTYNAIKYGLTLDQSSPYNYLATDSTVVWDGTTNAAYKTNIAGICRDDVEGLTQKQSRSVNANSIVAIGLGSIENTNTANSSTFNSNKSYLCWGSNNASDTVTSGDLPTGNYNQRLVQEWKVQTTSFNNTTQPVEFKFDLAGLSGMSGNVATNFKLLIDTDGDGDFNTGAVTAVPATAYGSEVVTISGVTQLTNGAVFTLASTIIPPAPGGVSAGLKLWLRADTGIVAAPGVSQWTDMSGNSNNFIQANVSAQPLHNNSLLANFNPSIKFNSGKFLEKTTGILNSGTYPVASIFSVALTDSLRNAPIFIEETAIPLNALGLNAPYGDAIAYWNGPQSSNVSAPWGGSLGTSYLWSGINTLNTQTLCRNGLQIANSNMTAVPFNGNNNPAFIGSSNSGTDSYNGLINELIIYTDTLSVTDVQKIQTYTAIKYGLTLDQTTANNYINTAGSIVWDAGINSAYNNNIAGIANDNLERLVQKQSRSANPGAIVTIGLGSIANNNAANTGSFNSDRSYLCWGSNNTNTSTQTTDLPVNFATGQRLNQEWKVQTTNFSNSANTLSFQFDLSNVAGVAGGMVSDFSLLIDSDGDGNFNTGTITSVPAASFLGNIVTINGVTQLTNGTVFTLLTKPVTYAPGGITAGLKLWLKADLGVNASGSINRWADQTLNGNHFTQSISGNQPTYNTATGLQNYNPTVSFVSSANNSLEKTTGVLGSGSYTTALLFTVAQNNTLNAGAVFSENPGADHLQLIPASTDGNAYWYGGSGPGVNASWGGSLGTPYLWTGINNANVQNLTRNGLQIASGTNTSSFTGVNGSAAIGYNNGSSAYFNGNLNELILYTAPLTTTDIRKVQTYNAVKWGLTLDQTTPANYIATDGSIVWNATANSGYKFNIGGIARDSAEALLQKQSHSVNTAGIVSIGLGSIAATNMANANNFTNNKSYLIWGSNNASTAVQITDVPSAICDVLQRLEQEWKVQATNFVNSANPVQLQFDLNGISGVSGTTASHFSLLIDKDGDGDFASGPVADIAATSFTSNIVTFNNITQLADGAVFTLATMKTTNPTPVVYLPADGTNTTSNVQCYKAGWLYFKEPSDPTSYIAAIYDPNFLIDPSKISVTINASSNYSDIGLGNSSQATRLMRRMLEVNCNNCFDTVANSSPNFSVRFPYSAAEKDAARNTETNNLVAIKLANGLNAYDSFYWYKGSGTVASLLPSLSPTGFPLNIASMWPQAAFTSTAGYVEFTGINRFSVFGGLWSTIPNVPLAIQLTGFEGHAGVHCQAELSWKFGTESTCKNVDVRYSTDGRNFNTVAQVAANRINTFSYKQEEKKAYYQLRMFDIDNKVSYSNVVMVNTDCYNEIFHATLYPNPSKGDVILDLSTSNTSNIAVMVYDASGRIVFPSKSYAVTKKREIMLSTELWAPGLYKVVSRNENTGETKTLTLVKK